MFKVNCKLNSRANKAETSNEKDPTPEFLSAFIKEDREEIRIIKNRIYTYLQVLIAASLAITAFFIKGSTSEESVIKLTIDKIENITISINVVFWAISVMFFFFQFRDLIFVRRCLKKRETAFDRVTQSNYFDSHKKFTNDWLLLVPMGMLTLIYIGVIVWLCGLSIN
jgi:hypothetical protein